MNSELDRRNSDSLVLIRLDSPFLSVKVAPALGGRIASLVDKSSGRELLWRNKALKLQALPANSAYDPNFYGGIDELLPNDLPETFCGVACPDHGELWTLPLNAHVWENRLRLHGVLPRFGLEYMREMWLSNECACLEFAYRITNRAGQPREFLWKLHAAVAVEPGDTIECPAAHARVVDPAWSRRKSLTPFAWPTADGRAVNVVPQPDGTVDFFYLYDLSEGRMSLRSSTRGIELAYEFDPTMFRCCWLFASYGGFDGHYTVILEPCTTMPISVNDAVRDGFCSRLAPAETLETRVLLRVSHITSGEKEAEP